MSSSVSFSFSQDSDMKATSMFSCSINVQNSDRLLYRDLGFMLHTVGKTSACLNLSLFLYFFTFDARCFLSLSIVCELSRLISLVSVPRFSLSDLTFPLIPPFSLHCLEGELFRHLSEKPKWKTHWMKETLKNY